MANWLDRLFGKSTETLLEEDGTQRKIEVDRSVYSACREWFLPTVADSNGITLFNTIPEVFFPIQFVAARVAAANFVLKKDKDDSVVFRNKYFNDMISRPNCLYDFRQLVYLHMMYKLATGNSYIKAAVPEVFTNSETPKYKNCRNYWVLPCNKVSIELNFNATIYGNENIEDIIRCYKVGMDKGQMEVLPNLVLHDKDNSDIVPSNILKATSRLASHAKNIDNLVAVYEARNLIYTKQGGLGWIVSAKSDDAGTGVLTDVEKKAIRESYENTYGLGKNQMPFGISDVPIGFVRTNLSIQDLQPFDETLADAVQIAGAYSVPAVLVPRKDQSTFSNQSTAEKSVYDSIIIPLAKKFCESLTSFLGYDQDGLYIDVDFSHVDCLQDGMGEKEDVNTKRSDRAINEFKHGLITLNDVRARIGESKVELDLFDKIIFEMTPDEREEVKNVLSLIGNNSLTNNTEQNGQGVEKPQFEDED